MKQMISRLVDGKRVSTVEDIPADEIPTIPAPKPESELQLILNELAEAHPNKTALLARIKKVK